MPTVPRREPCFACGHRRDRHRVAAQCCDIARCECTTFRGGGGVAPPRGHRRPTVSSSQVRAGLRANLTLAEMAEKFGVSTRTMLRAKNRALGVVPRGRIPEEEMARIRRLTIGEGMPMSWAADEFGRHPETYLRKIKPGMPPDWRSVWQSIRQNPQLLELHNEFAPSRSRRLAKSL